jgi:polysaccharide biosynthesis/export protein
VNIASRRGVLHDSEILFVQPGADLTVDRATLSGGTSFAGQYVSKNTNLSQLLKSPGALGENPYTLFGVISRRDAKTKLRKLIAFTPAAILNGREDMQLKSDDIVRVFSVDEARRLFAMVQKYNMKRELDEEAIRNPQAAAVGRTGADENTGLSAVMSAAQMQQQQGNSRDSALMALRSANNAASLDAASGQSNLGYPQQQGYSQQQQGYPQQQGYSQQQQGYPQQQEYPQQQGYSQQQIGPQDMTQPQGADAFTSQRSDQSASNNMEVFRLEDLARQVYVDPLVLVNFLEDRSVNIDGAVRGPGLYLVGPNVDIKSLLEAAGGVTQWADRRAVEVISTVVDTDNGKSQTDRKDVSLLDASSEDFFIAPHDGIRVSEVYTKVGVGSVTVQGEVRQAGTYQIVRGEHLSDVLQRAGGLTEDAYPYGTVFLRRSLAALEQDSYKRMAKQLQDQLILAMSRSSDTKLTPDAFTALQGYVKDLKNTKALGRMVVKADPAALKANPAADPLLEQGDVIFIPRQPFAVSVMGEVLQQNSVPYKRGLSATDYIELAGGYSQFADSSEIFVILPDGSARRVEDSWFNFGGSDVPPGSTVYVGRDISSYDTRQIILDITKIFAELATSAAAMAVLMENTK